MTNLTFLVCPHDTSSNPIRWQMISQYLSEQLSQSVQFELMLDFNDFRQNMDSADIVYANPSDTIHLIDTKGFVPIARPKNVYDEAMLVANTEIGSPTIESLQGVPVASVKKMLITNIALRMLKKQSIAPSEIADHDSWMAVISSVWRKDVDFGIVYKDTYNDLSDQGKSMVQLISTSNERVAFHSLLVGNNATPKRAEIEQIIMNMHTEDRCKDILAEHCFDQWEAVSQDEVAQMRQVMAG